MLTSMGVVAGQEGVAGSLSAAGRAGGVGGEPGVHVVVEQIQLSIVLGESSAVLSDQSGGAGHAGEKIGEWPGIFERGGLAEGNQDRVAKGALAVEFFGLVQAAQAIGERLRIDRLGRLDQRRERGAISGEAGDGPLEAVQLVAEQSERAIVGEQWRISQRREDTLAI